MRLIKVLGEELAVEMAEVMGTGRQKMIGRYSRVTDPLGRAAVLESDVSATRREIRLPIGNILDKVAGGVPEWSYRGGLLTCLFCG